MFPRWRALHKQVARARDSRPRGTGPGGFDVAGSGASALILDSESAEDSSASDDQPFHSGHVGARLQSLIAGAAENPDHFVDHDPIGRHLQLEAAEDRGHVHYRRVALNLRASQIDFAAAEDGDVVAAAEIVSGNLALESAENGDGVGPGAGPGPHLHIRDQPDARTIQKHHQAGADQDQRPQFPDPPGYPAQVRGQENSSDREHDGSPGLLVGVRGIDQLEQAHRDQNYRPEAPYFVSMDDAQVIQQKDHTNPGYDESRNES